MAIQNRSIRGTLDPISFGGSIPAANNSFSIGLITRIVNGTFSNKLKWNLGILWLVDHEPKYAVCVSSHGSVAIIGLESFSIINVALPQVWSFISDNIIF